jgi:hypothetical protein
LSLCGMSLARTRRSSPDNGPLPIFAERPRSRADPDQSMPVSAGNALLDQCHSE